MGDGSYIKRATSTTKRLGGLGVVNVRLKIKAQRVKFITRLLSGDGNGLGNHLQKIL